MLGCWVVGLWGQQHQQQQQQHHQINTNTNTINTTNNTPTTPRTPITPRKQRRQENTKKTEKKTQDYPKIAQERSRSLQKWRRNRKKRASPSKMAPGGAQGCPYPMSLIHFGPFWGPLWGPKIHQKSMFFQKAPSQKQLLTVFAAIAVFCDRCLDDV